MQYSYMCIILSSPTAYNDSEFSETNQFLVFSIQVEESNSPTALIESLLNLLFHLQALAHKVRNNCVLSISTVDHFNAVMKK